MVTTRTRLVSDAYLNRAAPKCEAVAPAYLDAILLVSAFNESDESIGKTTAL